MTTASAFQNDKKMLRKWLRRWFGTNRGTHWSVAGVVGALIFASYLIYNNHDSGPPQLLPLLSWLDRPRLR
jgi:hypothetical protein